MERLTKRELLGGHNIAYASGDDCFEVWSVPKKFMGNAIDRLAYIEDILGDNYDLSRLRDLVQADRDGRCVVLSEPMSPMVQIPGDTDVYCPNCAQTLSGGWPLSDAGDYRKMCQCPNCGQAIDDTKCEIVYEVTRGEKHG